MLPRLNFPSITKGSVSASCVANSAGDSEGWWTTCTETTRTTSRGAVTSVMRRLPSSRRCTDTSRRSTTLSGPTVRSVGNFTPELSQCYSISSRWRKLRGVIFIRPFSARGEGLCWEFAKLSRGFSKRWEESLSVDNHVITIDEKKLYCFITMNMYNVIGSYRLIEIQSCF